MSDDRFTHDPDDEANANDPDHPYIDRVPPPGVRPALSQLDRRGPPTPEEIEAFIAKEFGGGAKTERKRLIRPPGWDAPSERPAERGDAYEGPSNEPCDDFGDEPDDWRGGR